MRLSNLGISVTGGSGLTVWQRLLAVFSTGTNGFIYDPSDMASLYQDVGKTTPVTVVTNPVGSMSDKSGVYGSGALTQITTAVATGGGPQWLAVDPLGRFVYVPNQVTATVSMYSINQTTGVLTSIGAAVACGAAPRDVIVDPTGKFAYVANYTDSTVSMYSINQTTGALTSIGAAVATGANPIGAAADPLGRFVYVTNLTGSTVSMYSINQTTGALTSIGAAVACGNSPRRIAVDPTGKFVYVANFGASTVSMYSINQTTGALTSIGAAVASGTSPAGVAADPTGKFVYVANDTDSTVSMYSINQTTGVLTSIGAAVASGTNPVGVAVDPTGKFVYVANSGAATVSMYSIDQTTGALTSITTAIASANTPYVAIPDSTGRFVYVLNAGSDSVSMYFIQRINYLTQATAAARPTWTNRVNLLLQSNAFTTWVAAGTPNPVQNEVGITGAANEAWTLTDASAVAVSNVSQSKTLTAAPWTSSVFVKKTTGVQSSYPLIEVTGAGLSIALCTVDTSNGVATAWTAFTGYSMLAGISARCTSFNSLFWRVELTYTATAAVAVLVLIAAGTTNPTQSTGTEDAAAQGSAVFQGAQWEPGSTATRYQRVTTATDFDTAGFPYYLSFLGTDDCLTSATGGGGSAGFFWCGAVLLTGGAGTLQTLFADNGTNTGYKVQLDAANKLSFSAGNNTAFTTKVSTATVNVGTKYMLTVWDDGTNLNVQIDSAAAETVARPVVVAGTAGYTIGKDNGAASSFFIGYDYASVYLRNTGLTAAQRASVQAWVKQKAGL